MAAKFEIVPVGDQFLFHLKAANGEVILTSQPYKSRAYALNGIESVRKNSAIDGRYEIRKYDDGSIFFVLKSANSQVIGTGKRHQALQPLQKGIASVKKNAPGAKIPDR